MPLYPTNRAPLSPSDLAWIAGIIDMKGSITGKNNKNRRTLQRVLFVESRHRPLILRLSEYTDTHPEESKNTKPKAEWLRKGCSEHCPEKHIHQEVNMPLVSRWQVTGTSLAIITYNVVPYLTPSERTKELIETMETIASELPLVGPGRGAIDAAIRRLSNLGWIIPDSVLREEMRELAV